MDKLYPYARKAWLVIALLLALVLGGVILEEMIKKGRKINPDQWLEEELIRVEHYRECKQDLDCWGPAYKAFASSACEAFIEVCAARPFKWTHGWLRSKFKGCYWKSKTRSSITYAGDRLQFKDETGVWQNMKYQCDYDPVNKRFLGVSITPGRF